MVLARKWRPQGFESLVGQEHIAQTLTNAITHKRIHHGFLFTGTRGVGKTSTARILTKALNCIHGPTPNPCGVCENCTAIQKGTFMDVLEIDGASNRSIEDIRDLKEQIRYAPVQGKYKVYIIDEVHMLTKEAFNALLKTLEEPPAHVVFIFATTELRKVPETILSRVQKFDFKRIPEAKIKQKLAEICASEGVVAEEEALDMIARRGDGSMRDSLSYFDQVYAFAGNDMTAKVVREMLGVPSWDMYANLHHAIIQKNKAVVLEQLDSIYQHGFEISEFLNGFGEYLRNLVFAGQPEMKAENLGFSASQFEKFIQDRLDVTDEDLIRTAKGVAEIIREQRDAVNPRLAIEMGLLRLASLDRAVSLEMLMKKVAAQFDQHEVELKKKSLN